MTHPSYTSKFDPCGAPALQKKCLTRDIRIAKDARQSRIEAPKKGFTLIELLVVISIIGALASLTVGLSKLAGRKNKESYVRGEMAKLINAIENYNSNLGFYPPDHRVVIGNTEVGQPSPNQLYYELSGTIFTNGGFALRGSTEIIPGGAVSSIFGSQGFANSARDARDLKFTESFKASEYHRVQNNPPIDILSVAGKPPPNRAITDPLGAVVNPWLYVSTSPTNNPGRYDLWTEVVIGKNVVRFSNWEKDPVVVQ